MARPLIVVGGLGDYGTNLVRPSIGILRKKGYIDCVTVVDFLKKFYDADIDELKSEGIDVHPRPKAVDICSMIDMVADEKGKAPIVLLAHHNSLHTPEAVKLMDNSSFFPGVMVEKPYAINAEQIIELERIIRENPGRVALPEYGMALKCVPTLLLQGAIRPDSFYFGDMGVLKVLAEGRSLNDLSGTINELTGDITSVTCWYLEGEGKTGVIGNRTLSLVDRREGGGMIQDLFHHAVTLVGDMLGPLDGYKVRDVKLGFCNEYVKDFKDRVGGIDNLGESSAKIKLVSPTGVPVTVYVGKYMPHNANLRECVIEGSKGKLVQDLSDCILWYVEPNGTRHALLQADKSGKSFPKYAPVLMAAIGTLEGMNPYNLDPVQHALGAQRLILDILNTPPSDRIHYKQGAEYEEVFG